MSLLTKRSRADNSITRKKRKLLPPTDHTDSDAAMADDGEEFGGIGGAALSEPEEGTDKEDDEQSDATEYPRSHGKHGILDGLRDMQDAAELYQSSSFKLQIDALLPNVRPKTSRVAPLERTLHALFALFNQLPSIGAQHPLEASKKLLKKKGIAVPYPSPLPTQETNWKVSFDKPTNVTLVGSWANKLSVKGKDGASYGVDLALEMPDELFQEKDYLNYRFFHKRAFFIACIADAIQTKGSKLDLEVTYTCMSEDPRLTVLELRPRKENADYDFSSLNAHIRIIPTLSPTSPMPLHRLSPLSSNVRSASSDSTTDPLSTPLYNNAILTHFTSQPFILAALQLKKISLAFPDALTLLRLWANQRGYTSGGSLCVHGFQDKGLFWGELLGMLINGEDTRVKGSRSKKRKPLGGGLSSYQLFRGALDFLGTHDFGKEGVFTRSAQGSSKIQPGDFSRAHEAVLVDSGTMVNLLADTPLNSLDLLKADARKTLGSLDQQASPGFDPFQESFLQDLRDPSSRFDAVIRVDLSSAQFRDLSPHDALDRGSAAHAFMSSLNKILRRGLGNRTTAAAILHPASSPRPLTSTEPTNHRFIHIGLIYDDEHAFRVVDHGPSPDEADTEVVEAFRHLWGPKAELRRFQDGRITESVVWDASTVDEKARIPTNVVLFLLEHHFGIGEEKCHTWQREYDLLLRLPSVVSKLFAAGNSGAIGFGGARQAAEGLIKLIRGMDEELPLLVTSISATSESLRSTSPFAPVPMKAPSAFPETGKYQPVLQLVIEFEKSSRWPDDLVAIQTTKLAFLEHVASALLKTGHATIARVCVGDGSSMSVIEDQASLEVVTTEGWAFALRISHDRELSLLERIIKNKPVPGLAAAGQGILESSSANVQDALHAKFTLLQRFVHGPRHHRAIAALCHTHPAYAGTVRLVKRWIASHWLLDLHILPEVVEVMCAHLFVGRGSLVPQSKERGFALMIKFFKDWAWEDGALDVSLYDQDKTVNVHEKKPKTIAYSAPYSTGVWRVSTEFDKQGKMWTARGPDAVVSRRLRALAGAAWEGLKGMESGELKVAVRLPLLFALAFQC